MLGIYVTFPTLHITLISCSSSIIFGNRIAGGYINFYNIDCFVLPIWYDHVLFIGVNWPNSYVVSVLAHRSFLAFYYRRLASTCNIGLVVFVYCVYPPMLEPLFCLLRKFPDLPFPHSRHKSLSIFCFFASVYGFGSVLGILHYRVYYWYVLYRSIASFPIPFAWFPCKCFRIQLIRCLASRRCCYLNLMTCNFCLFFTNISDIAHPVCGLKYALKFLTYDFYCSIFFI